MCEDSKDVQDLDEDFVGKPVAGGVLVQFAMLLFFPGVIIIKPFFRHPLFLNKRAN